MSRFLFLLVILLCESGAATLTVLRAKIAAAAISELPSGTRVVVKDAYCRFAVPDRATVAIVNPHPPLGVVSFEAHWLDRGHPRKVFGSASLKVSAKIAVAKTLLKHRDLVQSESVSFEWRDLSTYSASGFFTEPGRVVGRPYLECA